MPALSRLTLVSYSRLPNRSGLPRQAGALLDLGLSSNQLADVNRGFSFQTNGPLDMRLDPRLTTTAADLVNKLSEAELYQLFTDYGEEPRALAIASVIVKKPANNHDSRAGPVN